jgi:multiple sugar transport system substrate-binding protein
LAAEFSLRQALLPLDEYYENWNEKDKINQGAIDFNKKIVNDQKL